MTPRTCYGHTSDGPWEPLEHHLEKVADLARSFADALRAPDWGELAGLWHDLGKYSDEFQDYLELSSGIERANAHVETIGRVDHSTAGAQHAVSSGNPLGLLLAYCIAGHHGGMPDTIGDASLEARLAKSIPVPRHAPPELLARPLPLRVPLTPLHKDPDGVSFQVAFFARMVFSSLVDADFLATESFMSPHRHAARTVHGHASVHDLGHALADHLDTMAARSAPSRVNTRRAEVLAACRRRAGDQPGFFSLTVPTGGGKTLSSLAFALRHADMHALRRVIVAIPFTSIIEQNADVYRKALGLHAASVIEHHSNTPFEAAQTENQWSRLAAENWDAPVIVTTTVQLYESLFANTPSRCRKLHRIANSVIVLDEAQSIPVRLLRPTLAALQELVRNYGCSVVLCTATQPAVNLRDGFPIGLPLGPDREIIPDVPGLFTAMSRVRVEPPRTIPDEELAQELAGLPGVLCIVHTRRQCRELFLRMSAQVGEEQDLPLAARCCLHLSTDMCPEHRSFVIRLIRRRLKHGLPCRVVSTSLIEAGVDVDFPVVYRAVAGLDSIAQAAGRCNREGKLPVPGRVVVFRPEHPLPSQMQDLKLAIQDAEGVMKHHHGDLLHPDAIATYFREHYWKRSTEWDTPRVMECFRQSGEVLNFRTAAEKYRLIENTQTPVVVPWGRRGRALIEELKQRDEPADRLLRRRVQRFSVGCWPYTLRQLQSNTTVTEPQCSLHGQPVGIGIQTLVNPAAYSPILGLNPEVVGADPSWLIEGV